MGSAGGLPAPCSPRKPLDSLTLRLRASGCRRLRRNELGICVFGGEQRPWTRGHRVGLVREPLCSPVPGAPLSMDARAPSLSPPVRQRPRDGPQLCEWASDAR